MTATRPEIDTSEQDPQPAPAGSGRLHLRVVLAVASVVLLAAEVGVRLVEDRLPPPADWYTPEYALKQSQMAELAASGGASVVFIGSSVIDVSIDPAQLDGALTDERPAYNAALLGANLEMVDVWSEHVVEPTLDPDVVVIGVSSRDVNRNGASLEGQTPGFYRLPAVRRLLDTESPLERFERWAGDVSRLVHHRRALRRPLEALFGYDAPGEDVVRNTDLGHELHLADTTYRGDPTVEQFFRSDPLLAFAPSETQLGALRRTIRRLRADGVRVLLLDVPVTEHYLALHPAGAADYETYEIAIRLLAEQEGAELLDAGTWSPSGFSDPLHLNVEGTRALTRVVNGFLAGEGVVLPEGSTPPAIASGSAGDAAGSEPAQGPPADVVPAPPEGGDGAPAPAAPGVPDGDVAPLPVLPEVAGDDPVIEAASLPGEAGSDVPGRARLAA